MNSSIGKKIEVSAPEDLVLSGALEHAFKNDGVEFDKQHGSLIIAKHQHGHVRLEGGDDFHALMNQPII